MSSPTQQWVGRSRRRGVSSARKTSVRLLRYLGALGVAAVGAIHLQRYSGAGYSSIPTIGPLFLANAISSGIVALLLVVVDYALVALAGIGIAAGSLIALFISEGGGLFGFTEAGYSTPVVLSIVAEVATIVVLAAYLGLRLTAQPTGSGSA